MRQWFYRILISGLGLLLVSQPIGAHADADDPKLQGDWRVVSDFCDGSLPSVGGQYLRVLIYDHKIVLTRLNYAGDPRTFRTDPSRTPRLWTSSERTAMMSWCRESMTSKKDGSESVKGAPAPLNLKPSRMTDESFSCWSVTTRMDLRPAAVPLPSLGKGSSGRSSPTCRTAGPVNVALQALPFAAPTNRSSLICFNWDLATGRTRGNARSLGSSPRGEHQISNRTAVRTEGRTRTRSEDGRGQPQDSA